MANDRSDKWLMLYKMFDPRELRVLVPGLHFKPATNGQKDKKDKGFLLTSTFVPKGLSAPALGLSTSIKALKYIPGPGGR